MRVWLCASALLVFSIVIRVISPHPGHTASANSIQTTPAQISTEEPATPDAFSETLRIGRGAILHAEWYFDGERVLAASVRGTWVYRLLSDRIVDEAHLEQARLGRFSHGGGYIAGVNNQNDVTLWNASDYSAVAVLAGHDAYVRAIAWRPATNQLASLDRTGRILVWDANSRVLIAELQLDGADQIVWSPGGTYLAAASRYGGLTQAWRISGDEIAEFAPPSGGISSIDLFWRNETQLLLRQFSDPPSGMLWDISADTLTAVPFVGYATAYSPDGTKLAGAGVVNALVNDAESGETLVSATGMQYAIVSWSPDNRHVAFGDRTGSSYGPARVFLADTVTGEVQTAFNADFSIRDIVWAPDGEDFLIIDSASQIHYLADDTLSNVAHTEIGAAAAWRDDGQLLAVSDTVFGAGVWDSVTGEFISRLHSGLPATQLAWQPNGSLLATATGTALYSDNNNVHVWDTSRSVTFMGDSAHIVPHVHRVVALAWSPDGRMLATLERERYIRLTQPTLPETMMVVDFWAARLSPHIDYTRLYHTFGWSPDSDWIHASYTSSGNPGGVSLVEVDTGLLVTGDTPPNAQSTWRWTPDSRFIWARWDRNDRLSSDERIRVGGAGITDNDQPPLMLTGLPAPVSDAVFSPDASRLAGFDVEHNAIIWDVAAHRPLSAFSGVHAAVWSPDASMAALYRTDGLIQIVDAQTGEALHLFEQHWQRSDARHEDRWQVVWSPDGLRVGLLGQGTLYVYNRLN